MASCGVLYIIYPETIPIPQNLNHISQESHQMKTFSPSCWYEAKANRNERLLKVSGFFAETARFETTTSGGRSVVCNWTQSTGTSNSRWTDAGALLVPGEHSNHTLAPSSVRLQWVWCSSLHPSRQEAWLKQLPKSELPSWATSWEEQGSALGTN